MTRIYLKINTKKCNYCWLPPTPSQLYPELNYREAYAEYERWRREGVFKIGNDFFTAEEITISETEILLLLYTEIDADIDITTTLEVFNLADIVLDNCKSQDEICLHGVKFIKDVLKIDRAAVLLLTENQRIVQGTWGTNARGEIVEEKDQRNSVTDNQWLISSLKQSGILLVNENADLYDENKVIAKGWHAVVSIYHRKEPIGWLVCDNLITGRPISANLRSQVAHFGNMLGQWLIRVKNENDLTRLNANLEQQVAIKTEALQKTIDELTHTQRDLIRTEKTKALSTFTAGVAHEINNPIGFIRSNLSYIGKVSSNIVDSISLINLPELEKTKSLLSDVDQVIDESVEGLDRVKNIISMLQPLNKLADEIPQKFDIVKAIEFAVMGLSERNETVKVISSLEESIVFLPLQIFTLAIENVLQNSLDATQRKNEAEIIVNIDNDSENLLVRCEDNGCGISVANIGSIFLPFFTTKAPGEGLGLGLSLSQNLIQLANGDMHVKSQEGKQTTMTIEFSNEVLRNA